MKRDHVLRIVLTATHPGRPSHGSVTHFALCNTFMIVLPRGASPNSYSPTFTRTVSQSSRYTMVCRHNSNLRPTVAHFLLPNWSPTSADIDTNMSILSLLSNSYLPPHSLLNFLQPLSWDELEAREGSLGSSYHSDLLDLLFAFLSTMDAVPTPHFPASPEAVTAVLVQGCHRPPGVLTGLFHSHIEPHETPHQYYQRIFIFSLRFPALATLGVPPPDVLAIEEAVRHILLRCSLPQALDFLHTQLLAGICVANPVRDSPTYSSLSPLLHVTLLFLLEFYKRLPLLPQFRCWITRRISPNMAVISLKCNSSSWACSLAKGNIDGSYHFGFSPGNFLQLAFPCTKEFNNDNNANSIHFAFAIYLLNTSGGKGRISTETPQTQTKRCRSYPNHPPHWYFTPSPPPLYLPF